MYEARVEFECRITKRNDAYSEVAEVIAMKFGSKGNVHRYISLRNDRMVFAIPMKEVDRSDAKLTSAIDDYYFKKMDDRFGYVKAEFMLA